MIHVNTKTCAYAHKRRHFDAHKRRLCASRVLVCCVYGTIINLHTMPDRHGSIVTITIQMLLCAQKWPNAQQSTLLTRSHFHCGARSPFSCAKSKHIALRDTVTCIISCCTPSVPEPLVRCAECLACTHYAFIHLPVPIWDRLCTTPNRHNRPYN